MKAWLTVSGGILVVAIVLILIWFQAGSSSVPLILSFVLAMITFGQFAYSAWPSLYAKMVTEFPLAREAGEYLSTLKREDLSPPLFTDRPVPYYKLRNPSHPLQNGTEIKRIPALNSGADERVRGYLSKAGGELQLVYGQDTIVAPAYLDLHIVNAGPGVATKIECKIQDRKGGGYVVELTYYAILGRFFGREGRFEFNSDGEWIGPL